MTEGVRTPNVPLGTQLSEFLGHEIVGGQRSIKRFPRSAVLGVYDALAGGAGGGVVFTTKSQADSHLAYAANIMAWVVTDPNPALNGSYQKQGVSGAGSWLRVADLPNELITLSVTGGTADAIVAIASPQVPSQPISKLFLLTPEFDNTGPAAVTITGMNGGAPISITNVLGSSLAAHSLVAGSPVLMMWQSGHLQLLVSLPVDASGVLYDVLAARDDASGYASAASDFADSAQASASALGNQVHQYDTRAMAIAATIPAVLNFVRTLGYASAGIGGALYVRGATSPGSFTSNGGAVTWVLASQQLDICMFGADPTASADSASAINLACSTGKPLYIPDGTYLIGSVVNLGSTVGVSASLYGRGQYAAVFQRAPTYTSGHILNIDNPSGPCSITGLRINNASGIINTTNGAGIHLGLATDITIRNVDIWNGATGLYVDGDTSARVVVDNFRYIQDSVYGVVNDSFYGIAIVGQHHFDLYFTNCVIISTAGAAHTLQTGIYIDCADGLQFANVSIGGPNVGIHVAGTGSKNVDDIYFVNCLVDNVKQPVIVNGFNAPHAYMNIRFSACHFNGQNSAGSADGVTIAGDADGVQLIGCNINLAYGNGIVIGAGNAYDGAPKRQIIVSDNIISDNNLSNSGGFAGISVADGATGFTITGNSIGNRAAGHQYYGVRVGNSCGNFILAANNCVGNVTAGILVGSSAFNYANANNIG